MRSLRLALAIVLALLLGLLDHVAHAVPAQWTPYPAFQYDGTTVQLRMRGTLAAQAFSALMMSST
jgi:hypothetical protein